MENKELKPKSFRIDDETAEKFKQIANVIGGNQQETLAKLIESFEFQQGKTVLTEKKADIELFEKYATILTRMYMSSLEDNQNITETVRIEFDALLKSKDATIQDLQEKLTVSKQLKEEFGNKSKLLSNENLELSNKILKLEKEAEDSKQNYESILNDKNNLNRALTDSCNDLKQKNEEIQSEYKKLKEKSNLLEKIVMERDKLKKEKEELAKSLLNEAENNQTSILILQQQHAESLEHLEQQAELKLEKALFELERKYQEQIQNIIEEKQKESEVYRDKIQLLKEEKQKEIDKYQEKYFNLFEKNKLDEGTHLTQKNLRKKNEQKIIDSDKK